MSIDDLSGGETHQVLFCLPIMFLFNFEQAYSY